MKKLVLPPHLARRWSRGFTLVELLTVIMVIAILAGLILSVSGYVQNKAARSRAESEIAGMSVACESYKADNGIYPRASGTNGSDSLDARKIGTPASYAPGNELLYRALSGDTNLDRGVNATDSTMDITGAGIATPSGVAPPSYFQFKPNMLTPSGGTGSVTGIADPFGNNYGYSTANAANSATGYNPTFDLWSTAGQNTNPPATGTDTVTPKWVKNW